MEPDNAPHSELKGQLGLSGARPIPDGVIPFKSGVILTPRARVQVPLRTVIPASYSASNLSLILSLSLHRINSAFLFSVVSKRGRVQLGVQFIPGRVLVYVSHRNSVGFDYDVHDGRWHSLALEVRGHRVSLHTSCGNRSLHADLKGKKVERLDREGSFLLGKRNHDAVPFEGAICQLDIYPSAEAAHHYCDYVKKHCRQADTHRPVFAPLLPLIDPNVTHTTALASRNTPKATAFSAEGFVFVPSDHLRVGNDTFMYRTPEPALAVSQVDRPGLERPTETVTSSLWSSPTPPTRELPSQTGVDTKEREAHSLVGQGFTDVPRLPEATSESTQASSSRSFFFQHLSTVAPKNLDPEATSAQDVKPTPVIPVTPAAIDDFQTFDLEPTLVSLLAGPPGLKGEPGPPVSQFFQTCVGEFLVQFCQHSVYFGFPGDIGPPGQNGPEGPKGRQGARGFPGPQGTPGLNGDEGPIGPAGPAGIEVRAGDRGKMGTPGPPGESGPMVRSKSWSLVPRALSPLLATCGLNLSCLLCVSVQGLPGKAGDGGLSGEPGDKGDLGPSGNIGEQGLIGQRGEHGIDGEAGPSGPDGVKGEKGDAGAEGAMGDKGEIGQKGEDGPSGPPGLSGVRGQEGKPGKIGEGGKAGDKIPSWGCSPIVNWKLSLKSLGFSPPLHTCLLTASRQGTKGHQGHLGESGPMGEQGAPGFVGLKGARGTIGPVVKHPLGAPGRMGQLGEPGIPGYEVWNSIFFFFKGNPLQGTSGSKGPPGPEGSPGPRGVTGREGLEGLHGMDGLPGTDGSKGAKGEQGEDGGLGLMGKPGPQGKNGETGLPGSQGSFGSKGERGLPGQTGPSGIRGIVGSEGLMGNQGLKGSKGQPGDIGEQGFAGVLGLFGPKGPQGDMGPAGIQGPKGPRGLMVSTSGYSLNYHNMDLPMLDQGTEIFRTLEHLSSLIHSLKNPLGKRNNPARICRDLYNCEQRMYDGTYWIDPNLGCDADTIEVTCNFTAGGQTCLKPVTVSKVEMGVGRIQMNFIHLLSSEAVQHITVHCFNTPVWAAGPSLQHYSQAVSFKTWTGEKIRAGDLLEPLVPRDDCWIKDGRWRQTHFVFQTQEPNLLPIVEISNLPTTEPGSRYHLEVGPVCFL
uniref:Fibrillar collagen NC1 domain-containing protein n=1 Tax=Hippocampus comes TaxID=109280 RepID=A0A3Q2YCF7_HIPCM